MQLDASLLDELARCFMQAALAELLRESTNEKPAVPDGATAGSDRDQPTGDHYRADADSSRFQSLP